MITNDRHTESSEGRQVRELLLSHLRAADAPPWPGVDGVTLEDILANYPQAAAVGVVPDLPALMREHPELAATLREYFAC
jgi:hypothetical protein